MSVFNAQSSLTLLNHFMNFVCFFLKFVGINKMMTGIFLLIIFMT